MEINTVYTYSSLDCLGTVWAYSVCMYSSTDANENHSGLA